MRKHSARSLIVLNVAVAVAVAMALAVTATAQEGHPLTGTWYGDYGSGNQKFDLTVIMKWDGTNVTGTVNPGPTATPLAAVVLDITPGKVAAQGQNSTTGTPPIFKVRFEADLPNAAGTKQRTSFEGTLQNPVAGNRRLTGNWTRGTERGTFQLRRQ